MSKRYSLIIGFTDSEGRVEQKLEIDPAIKLIYLGRDPIPPEDYSAREDYVGLNILDQTNTLSKTHGRIDFNGDHPVYEDILSRYGTTIKGTDHHVETRQIMLPGLELLLGKSVTLKLEEFIGQREKPAPRKQEPVKIRLKASALREVKFKQRVT